MRTGSSCRVRRCRCISLGARLSSRDSTFGDPWTSSMELKFIFSFTVDSTSARAMNRLTNAKSPLGCRKTSVKRWEWRVRWQCPQMHSTPYSPEHSLHVIDLGIQPEGDLSVHERASFQIRAYRANSIAAWIAFPSNILSSDGTGIFSILSTLPCKLVDVSRHRHAAAAVATGMRLVIISGRMWLKPARLNCMY